MMDYKKAAEDILNKHWNGINEGIDPEGLRNEIASALESLESRLKQSESELEAVVKERDLYNKNYLALESRLKEANSIIEAKHDYCSSLCCDIANLQERLSKAEARVKELENPTLEKIANDYCALAGYDKEFENLKTRLSQAEAETERFKSKWAKYVDHFWCDCGLTDEQRDKGEDCTFEGTKTCGYCMAKIQKGRINELKSRLSHLMDVAGQYNSALMIIGDCMGRAWDDAVNLKKAVETAQECLKKHRAEWDGIEDGGGK